MAGPEVFISHLNMDLEALLCGYQRFVRLCVLFAGVVFLLTSAAKIISAFGNAKILNFDDPILGMRFSYLMFFVGLAELAISFTCFLKRYRYLSLHLIAWFSTLAVIYRIGLRIIGQREPCHCLGDFAGSIHLNNEDADLIMKCVLCYLLVSSYSFLILSHVRIRRVFSEQNP